MTDATTARDVADLVREQHDEVERLLSLVDTRTGDDQREAFEDLVRLLAVHETAEEEVVYPMLRSLTGGDAIADARIDEESKAKEMLAELEKVGVDGEGFESRFTVFRDAVKRHATQEEETVLPLLERTQDQDKLDQMANAMRVAESLAPTHPHPHAPDSAIGNMAVGPFAAVVDRARDALRSLTR
jgi:hemerythrin superfamily protein